MKEGSKENTQFVQINPPEAPDDPNSQLVISGITTTFQINVGTAGTVISSTSSGSVGVGITNPVHPFQIGESVLVVTESGSVGVGTTNPTSSFHVNGDVRVGVDTSFGLVLTSPGGLSYRLGISDGGTLFAVLVP